MDFETSWVFTKKYTPKPYSFLVIDTTLASVNRSLFWKNLFIKNIKTNHYSNKSRYGKLQYEINGNGAKIPALSSGKIDKYEYLAGEEILPPNQGIVI